MKRQLATMSGFALLLALVPAMPAQAASGCESSRYFNAGQESITAYCSYGPGTFRGKIDCITKNTGTIYTATGPLRTAGAGTRSIAKCQVGETYYGKGVFTYN